MGYRSDVLLAIGHTDKNKMLNFLTKLRLEGKFIPDLMHYWSLTPDGCVMFLYADQWKWYDGYPEVQYHESLLDEATQFDLNTIKIRIGEETDDNEVMQNTRDSTTPDEMYDMGISRTLSGVPTGNSIKEGLKNESV